MYDITLRQLKDRHAKSICLLLPYWITPNIITFIAFIFGLLSCLTAALTAPMSKSWPLIFWLSNRALDGLDGSLARERRLASELGGFLDLLGDFVIYSLLPIAVAHGVDTDVYGLSAVDWRAVAMVEASFHINNFVLFYIAAVAAKRDRKELTSVTMRPALIEGFESGMIFTAMLVWPGYITLLCWGMSAAVAVGVVQRVSYLVPVLKRLD
ncbi:MAG: CDP-alcohol phosphatidyltransferase [Lasallia pustulata]|uniref:CDP-alcohol phosphatidyltransferase n=1 Tax=Lasallia pustulata TaxID=136370 RepID=A0A5M8PTC7_9LECA|nr:MAG: CDP-alcohol phosphatidyltransferase [Lasallia pustulata]